MSKNKIPVFLFVLFILCSSQVKAPKTSNLIVSLSAQDWNMVLYAINLSTAPHNLVTEVQTKIISQLSDSIIQSKYNQIQSKKSTDTTSKK